ncbi:AAA family ATPase [Pseudomonas laurentiana]
MKIKFAKFGSARDKDIGFRLKFRSPSGEQNNQFSVLIGENGTRKSRTLRDIVDSAVIMAAESTTRRLTPSSQLTLWRGAEGEEDLISKVIAISGVASDRFPARVSSRRLRSLKDFYDYIGPRTENNLVSRSHSINQIAMSLLTWPDRVRTRHRQLRHAFSILKVENGILFEFAVPKSVIEDLSSSDFKRRLSDLVVSAPDYLNINEKSALDLIRSVADGESVELRLDLDDSVRIDSSPLDFSVMRWMLDTGLLAIEKSYTYNEGHKVLPLSEFSSGQWQILSSLLYTALSVEDNTLILVDEPENSLHPAWQQQYLRMLHAIIGCVSGVHVIVATHSPLIAASLSPDVSEVIQLKQWRGRVIAKPITSGPFGWTADEILKSVFGLETSRSLDFSTMMDSALSLFARGDRKNPRLLKSVTALAQILPDLPEDDVARELILTLTGVLGIKVEEG